MEFQHTMLESEINLLVYLQTGEPRLETNLRMEASRGVTHLKIGHEIRDCCQIIHCAVDFQYRHHILGGHGNIIREKGRFLCAGVTEGSVSYRWVIEKAVGIVVLLRSVC
jgi:hypothetical protein